MVKVRTSLLVTACLGTLILAGCKGVPAREEKQARRELQRVGEAFRPQSRPPALPALDAHASLSNFLQFAVLNHPSVEAAYFDWAASVERITRERSLPDPRLTFQTDVAEEVMSIMPGLMFDLPGPGKLKAMGSVASAESQVKFHAFQAQLLQITYNFKKSYYQLYFLDHKIGVTKTMLGLLGEIERIARTQNEVGKGTLQDVLRAQIEQDRLKTELVNVEDSRTPLLAAFKGALGLKADDPNPPLPAQFDSTPLDLNADDLLKTALLRNPRLKSMQAEVQRADASLRLAFKARVPDFTLGLEADAKAFPVMYRPQASMTLPIWRDKIAAQIAEAQADKRSAEAKFTSEQIMLAIDFAEKTFMFREASRNLVLLQNELLPKASQALQIARAGYSSGTVDFINLLDSERTLLDLQLTEVQARTQRELALAEVALLIVGVPGTGFFPGAQAQAVSSSPTSTPPKP